jgi:NADPH-dependent 2,4-dienoyl-CoA reductase/sulfur reductase-like enzyme
MHIVVVGASLAGVRTVQALRRKGSDARITLVGAEPAIATDRPPLSKGFLGGTPEVAPPLLSAEQVAELDVELRLGTRAEGLDPAARTVALGGTELAYDRLVIATGSTPRLLPGVELRPGVHVLRTADDSAAIRARCVPGARVVVVGGGFIGAEVAHTALGLGCAVTLVEPLPALMIRGLGPALGEALTDRHRRAGVDLRLGIGVTGVDAGETGQRVTLTDGTELAADVVVVGIGTIPDTGWLAGSGLTLRDGVVCDEHLAAEGAPEVFVAGDVARWRHPRYGEHVRVEHWTNAVEQGTVVAANIVGEAAVHDSVPYVWSDQLGARLQIHGRVGPEDEVRVVRGDARDGHFVAVSGSGGKLTAVVGLGALRELMKFRRLLAANAPWQDAVDLAEELQGAA